MHSGLGVLAVLASLLLSGTAERRVSLLDYGPAGQGGDDTRTFEKALQSSSAAGLTLTVPATPAGYLVGPLRLPSNTRLVLERGVVIRSRPGFRTAERLINIEDVSNVEITGPGAVLKMNKPEYTSGEWRHCLYISGASDVVVRGISCNDSGGDGLYIGPGSRGYSRNITVEDATFDNNRRQGFSLTSGQDIWIRRCRFTNTNGAAPQAGIDLEPNGPGDRVANVHIEDSLCLNNRGQGVSIGLWKLNQNSAPIGITIERHVSRNNDGSGYLVNYETNPPGAPGFILVDKSSSENDGEYGAVASFFTSDGPRLEFRDLTVINPNRLRKTYDNAAVAVKRGGGGVGTMGNVHFIRPRICDDHGRIDYYFTFRDYSKVGFDDVEFRDPVELRGARKSPHGLFDGRPVDRVTQPRGSRAPATARTN